MANYFDKYDEEQDPVEEVSSAPKSNYFDKYDEPEQPKAESNYFDKYDGQQDNSFHDPSHPRAAQEQEQQQVVEEEPWEPAEERGAAADLGVEVGRAAVDTLELTGHVLKTAGARDIGQNLVDKAKEAHESDLLRADVSEAEGTDGFVKRGVEGGIRSAGPSLGSRVIGAAAGIAVTAGIGALTGSSVGPVGTIIGAIVGATVGTGSLFGLGIYGQSKDEALEKGLSEKDAHDYALGQALVEGGIEAATVAPEMALFLFTGGTSIAAQPVAQTIKEVLKTPLKQMVKNYAKVMAIETGTEMLQSGLGNELAQKYGMTNVPTDEAILESIIPAMTMSLLFGAGSHGYSAMQKKSMLRDLKNPNASQERRVGATRMVYNRLYQQDPELANAWLGHTVEAIEAGAPLDIDANFASYAHGRTEAESAPVEPAGPTERALNNQGGGEQIQVGGTGERIAAETSPEQAQDEQTIKQLAALAPEELQGIRQEAERSGDTQGLAQVAQAEELQKIEQAEQAEREKKAKEAETKQETTKQSTNETQQGSLVEADKVDIVQISAAMPGSRVTLKDSVNGENTYVVETRGGSTIEIVSGKGKIQLVGENRKEGDEALGSFDLEGERGLIQLIRDPEEVGTLHHEIYHGAEGLVLTAREVRILERKFGNEEGRAEGYRMFREGQGTKREQTIFQKIYDFVEGLVHYFAPTATSTMKKIESGKVWKRQPKTAKKTVDKSTKKSTKRKTPAKKPQKLRKKKEPRPRDYQPPKTKDGKFKGAPHGVVTDKDLATQRKFITRLLREGEVGRFWYEDSAERLLEVVNGNVKDAEMLIQLVAIYSSQANVEVNTYFAINAWGQYKRGVPEDQYKLKTRTQDKKAIDVLYHDKAWSGRKTNSFYLNLMNWIYENHQAEFKKLGLDAETVENISNPTATKEDGKVTVDMWMYRAYGYLNEGYGDDKSTGAYSFVENEVRRLADIHGWTPHQAQAAIWTAMKARYEFPPVKDATWKESFKKGLATKSETGQWQLPTTAAGLQKHRAIWRKHAMKLTSARSTALAREGHADYATFLDRATSVATWEVYPSLSLNANIRDVKKFTEQGRALIFDGNRDLLAEHLGIPMAWARASTGGYEGAVSENTLSHLIPVKPSGDFVYDKVRQYARALQYIFKQDAVPYYRADSQALKSKAGRQKLLYKIVNEKGKPIGQMNFFSEADAVAFAKEKTKADKEPFFTEQRKGRWVVVKKSTGRTAKKTTWKTQAEAERVQEEIGGEVNGGSYTTGVSLRFDRDLDRQMENRVLELLQDFLHPSAAFTKISPNELEILNFRYDNTKMPISMQDPAFLEGINNMLQEHRDEIGTNDSVTFYAEAEYGHSQDWKNDPKGTGILSHPSFPGSPSVQAWIKGRAKKFEALLAAEGNASRDSRVPKYRTRAGSQRTDERGIPVREDGRVALFHYSQTQGLKELDPSKHGDGIPGAESKRKALDKKNWVDRTYYGIQGGGYQKEPGLGNNLYHTSMVPGDLYDFGDDPLNLMAKAQKEREADPFANVINIYERLIKQAGYDGYFASQGSNGLVAAVYSKQVPESEHTKYSMKGERNPKPAASPALEELKKLLESRLKIQEMKKTIVDRDAGKKVVSNLVNAKGKVIPSRVAAKMLGYEKLIAKLNDHQLSVADKLTRLKEYLVAEATPHVRGNNRIQTLIPQIAKAKTEDKKIKLLHKAVRTLEELNDAALRRESRTKIKNLLKQTKLKDKDGVSLQVSGGFSLFDEVRSIKAILKLTQTQYEEQLEELHNLVDAGQEFTAKQLERLEKLDKRRAEGKWRKGDRLEMESILANSNAVKLNRLALYGNLGGRSGAEARQAYEHLKEMIAEKKLRWLEQTIELRQQREADRQEALEEVRGGGKELTDSQERLQADKNKSIWGKLVETARGYDDKHQSWEWMLDKLARYTGKAPLAAGLVRKYGRMVNRATRDEQAGLGEYFAVIQEKMAEIWGVDLKKLSKIRQKDADVMEETGVYLYNEKGERVEQVPLSQNEAYKRWMELQDMHLRGDLAPNAERAGWNANSIYELEQYMSPEIQAWAEWQLNTFYDEYYDTINPVFREMFHNDLAKVHKYSPIVREYGLGSQDDNLLNQNTPHASIIKSAIKGRVKSSDKPIKIQDGDVALVSHISQMEHFKAWATTVRDLRATFSSPEVRKAIRQYHGKDAMTVVDNFIDDFARGRVQERFQSKAIMWFRRNFTTAAIGLNPVVFLKQLTSIPAYAMDMPADEWAKRLPRTPGQIRKAAKTLMQSKVMQARYRVGFERDMILAMQRRGALAATGGQNMADRLMFLTKKGDKYAIVYGGWPVYSYYHEQAIKEGKTEAQAHEIALERFEETTSRTQQAGQLKDMNQYQRGSAFAQMFTMFYTAPASYYRSWMGGIRGLQGLSRRDWSRLLTARGSKAQYQAAKRVFIGQVVLPSMFMWVANGMEWDEDEQLKAALLGPLSGLFLLRDFGLYGYNFLTGQRNYSDPGLPPFFSTIGEGERAVTKIRKHKANFTEMSLGEWLLDADMWEAIQSTGTTVGNVFGMPFGPASRVAEGAVQSARGATVAPIRRAVGFSEKKLDQVTQDYLKVRKKIQAGGATHRGAALLKTYDKIRRDMNRQIRTADVSREERREMYIARAEMMETFLDIYNEL